MPREARHFTIRNFGIVVGAEVVAVLHELHRTAERRYLQSVPMQFQRPENLGPQQAADIGTVGVDPVLVEIAADRGAADVVVLFDADDVEPCPGEEGGGRQTIMAGADDDGVVGFQVFTVSAIPAGSSRCSVSPSSPWWRTGPARSTGTARLSNY